MSIAIFQFVTCSVCCGLTPQFRYVALLLWFLPSCPNSELPHRVLQCHFTLVLRKHLQRLCFPNKVNWLYHPSTFSQISNEQLSSVYCTIARKLNLCRLEVLVLFTYCSSQPQSQLSTSPKFQLTHGLRVHNCFGTLPARQTNILKMQEF